MTSLNEIVVVLKGFILHKGKVLTVQRAHDDEVGGGTWELVGGQIHFGEDLEAALLREIQEEVGLDVTVERILYATTFQTHVTRQVVILHTYAKAIIMMFFFRKNISIIAGQLKNNRENCYLRPFFTTLKEMACFRWKSGYRVEMEDS
jgi:8-oxo-dGTP pyrophosphatase MutT (NUDIX family)